MKKPRAKFGPKWWDRGGHFSSKIAGSVRTVGMDGAWPKPCRECLILLADG